ARDALGLGALAAVLLLIDVAVVRIDDVPSASSRWSRLVVLARSNWPASITFAAATLTVIAALQAGLALGLLAATLLAALQLAPRRRRVVASWPPTPRSSCMAGSSESQRMARRPPPSCGHCRARPTRSTPGSM